MDGVTILDTIHTLKTGLLIAIAVDVMFLFFLVDLIRNIKRFKNKQPPAKYYATLIGIPVAILTAIMFLIFAPDTAKYETQYKVVVSEEADLIKFSEKYNVISAQDDLYVVTKKREVNRRIK
jgi:hypothetical protein